MMKNEGQSVIREKLAEYVRLLKEEFSQGLILPTKTVPTIVHQPKAAPLPATAVVNNSKTEKKSGLMELKELKLEEYFLCSKTDLFRTFCDLERVKAFTQNSVSRYDCKKGGFFSLFSDNITGRFLNVVPHDRLDLLWRFKSWPDDHHSMVSITFHDEIDRTKLVVQQLAVPSQFYENTKVNFKRKTSTNQ